MQRIRLIVEYDGTKYSGWQYQNGQISIQQVLEEALFVLFKERIRVTAAGRTDAGVHARNQVVHFDIPDYDLYRLKRSLNGLIQKDIVVKKAEQAARDFHSRFSARARRYSYLIATQPTALRRSFSWPVFYPLNLTLLQQGAELITRYEDFRAFCKIRSEVKHHKCRIIDCRWTNDEDFLTLHITANRFLHGMVRAIVGTLIELGRGKISLTQLKQIIEARDRRLVPATAPAKGLTLEEVYY